MKKYYVYQLRAINQEIPFYIGKGTGKRMHTHLVRAKNGATKYPRFQVIRDLQAQGIEVIAEALFYTDDEQIAFKVEKQYIAQYHQILTNEHTDFVKDYPVRGGIPKPDSAAPLKYYIKNGLRFSSAMHRHNSMVNRLAMSLDNNPVKLMADNDVIMVVSR